MAAFPSFEPGPSIERQARLISDPVARLRFLRQHMNARLKPRRIGIARRARAMTVPAMGLLLTLTLGRLPMGNAGMVAEERRLVIPDSTPVALPAAKQRVWPVDRSETSELYSNGLRIDLTFAVPNRPRAQYSVYPLNGGSEAAKKRSTPAGIVYHTTESHLAPFEEAENHHLKQFGRNLLELIRREHSYHYVIDRFGRVFRVVEESDAAYHAGNSVWSDADGIYVNLNDSFLGVAFEGQTDATDEVTAAQIAAGRVLTEMLLARYQIDARNCVTHAQVSVNPFNMHIGSHTDWAGKFPFAGLGLPDNYSIPLASLYAFGFDYEAVFLRVTGTRWKGLDLAEQQVARQAAAEGMTVARYRAILQHRYKEIARALKEQQAEIEGGS